MHTSEYDSAGDVDRGFHITHAVVQYCNLVGLDEKYRGWKGEEVRSGRRLAAPRTKHTG